MKKILITLVAIVFSISLQAQSSEFGAGISYGTEILKVGLNLKFNYGVNEKIFISTNANFFMPEKTEVAGIESCEALTTVNLDGSYRFSISENLVAYPLLGMNYSRIGRVSNGETLDGASSFGVNIGVGAKFNEYFFETKYVTGEVGQIVLTLGYEIGW